MMTMSSRIEREKRTVALMIGLYCRAHHAPHCQGLCPECEQLRDYAFHHLDHCPFGDKKTTCRRCAIHCYSPLRRAQIAQVMRYAGPRMILHSPLAALRHLLGK